MQRFQLDIPLRDTLLAKISLNLELLCRYGDHDSWRMIHDHSNEKVNWKDVWIKFKDVSWFSKVVLRMESQSYLRKLFCSSELPSEIHSLESDSTSACSVDSCLMWFYSDLQKERAWTITKPHHWKAKHSSKDNDVPPSFRFINELIKLIRLYKFGSDWFILKF